jgi:hypothetical protein
MPNNVHMSTTATKPRRTGQNRTGGTRQAPARPARRGAATGAATRRWSGRGRLAVIVGVVGLTLWLGPWVVGAAMLIYGAHLRSSGWTWARVALHLAGTAIALSVVVFITMSFGAGPGLLAAVVAILAWHWDRNRQVAGQVEAVSLETQLDAAFAEGFNRGQREARQVRKSRERSVAAFDPDDPDSF